MSDPQFLRTILVLPVESIENSCEWYRRVLGFETVCTRGGGNGKEAANYAILKREGAEVHLIRGDGQTEKHHWTVAGSGYLYLIVRDILEVWREVVSHGAIISRTLQTENWGPRAFNIKDPSGNAIHIEEERR